MIIRHLMPRECSGYIDLLAKLNTEAWRGDGWNECWIESDDPELENPRTNSRALVRWWAYHNAEIFLAEEGGSPIGFAVGIQFNNEFGPKLEWWRQPNFEVHPSIGDYEMHAVYVHERYRRHGLFRELAQR